MTTQTNLSTMLEATPFYLENDYVVNYLDEYEDIPIGPISNNVHSPNHYVFETPCTEVIDVIRNVLGPEGFKNYCYGNVLKYVLRANKKNGKEDLEKAKKYFGWILDETN